MRNSRTAILQRGISGSCLTCLKNRLCLTSMLGAMLMAPVALWWCGAEGMAGRGFRLPRTCIDLAAYWSSKTTQPALVCAQIRTTACDVMHSQTDRPQSMVTPPLLRTCSEYARWPLWLLQVSRFKIAISQPLYFSSFIHPLLNCAANLVFLRGVSNLGWCTESDARLPQPLRTRSTFSYMSH